jgi:sugar-specific transcriptional regulator TrmB
LKSDEIIEQFKAIGFNGYEAKTFLVLLGGQPMSASEIAREAKLVRTSIYDTLKSFVARGYCNEIETSSILKYQIIDPVVIVDKIQREFNESNAKRISSLKGTFDAAAAISKYGANSSNGEVDNIELIRGYNKHRMEKYIEYLKRAKTRVLGMYRFRGIVSTELDDIAKDFVKRGGELRSIYRLNLNFKIIKDGKAVPASSEDLVRTCENFQNAGEQLRLCDFDIPNMTVFDDEIVFSNITDASNAKNKSADIIVKNESNAKYMSDLFEHYWSRSSTLEEYIEKKIK